MKILTTLYFLLAMTSPAFGAWASGGGQIHRDGHNPWFLQNTTSVRYCIDIDEVNFGVSAAEASVAVKDALNDWLTTFAAAEDDYYSENELVPYGQLRVGTQIFSEHPCSGPGDIDLRFQFGRLTSDQVELFENPREFVGIAVRTEYDKINLKGKGFVYLSPVAGPLAANHPRIHSAAWHLHDHFALKFVLRHELGHVFGIDHQRNSVMDERWPELFVDRQFLEDMTPTVRNFFERRVGLMRLFGLNTKWSVEGCGGENPVFMPSLFERQYSEESCGRVELDGNDLKIHFKDGPSSIFEMVGTSVITSTHTNSTAAVTM